MKNRINPLAIFLRFLKVGIIGFGGGSALIPVIEKEIVGGEKPMSETDYLKHTVIANITPGALPVKLGATCGYQLGGAAGAVAGAYGAMLPGVVMTLLIMALFSLMGPQAISLFRYASIGITVFIVMLLVSYTLKTCKQGNQKTNVILCGCAFFLTCGKEIRQLAAQLFMVDYAVLPAPLFDISTIHLMIVTFVLILFFITKPSRLEIGFAGILALGYCFFNGKTGARIGWHSIASYMILGALFCFIGMRLFKNRRKREKIKSAATLSVKPAAVAAIALFLAVPIGLAVVSSFLCRGLPVSLLGNVALSTVTSFGGGEAYVSVADGFFVQGGFVDADVYYTQLVPVANALPGPILVKIASGIGFLFGQGRFGTVAAGGIGLTAATLATGVCCSVALLMMQVYEAAEKSAFIKSLKIYILPVICGMLLSTSCAMIHEAVKITEEKGFANPISMLTMVIWVAALRWLHKKYHVHDLILLFGSAVLSLVLLLVM